MKRLNNVCQCAVKSNELTAAGAGDGLDIGLENIHMCRFCCATAGPALSPFQQERMGESIGCLCGMQRSAHAIVQVTIPLEVGITRCANNRHLLHLRNKHLGLFQWAKPSASWPFGFR